jgi:hypothetical protein
MRLVCGRIHHHLQRYGTAPSVNLIGAFLPDLDRAAVIALLNEMQRLGFLRRSWEIPYGPPMGCVAAAAEAESATTSPSMKVSV